MNFFTFKFLFLFIVFYVESFNSQPYNNWDDEKIVVINESQNCEIMNMESVYDDGWNQLPQIMFWKRIMHLSPYSCLVNCASNRKVLKMIPFQDWNSLTKIEKTEKREFYKKEFNLPSDEYVYVTSGKSKFYLFKKVYPSLAPGVAAFEKNTLVAAIASIGVVLGAAYMLWLYRRVVFGELKNSELKKMPDLNKMEIIILISLALPILFFGFYPEPILSTINISVENLINNYELVLKTETLKE